MFHTGVIILGFLIFHFIHFYWIKLGWVSPPAGVDSHDFYSMVILLFTQPIISIIYLVMFLFLGFHINHALQSGFQTMGWEHAKYTNAVKIFSAIYSIIITVGFSIIPLYFLFIY